MPVHDPIKDKLLQATYPPGTYKFHFIDKDFKPVKSGIADEYRDAPVDQQNLQVMAYNITIKNPWDSIEPYEGHWGVYAEIEGDALIGIANRLNPAVSADAAKPKLFRIIPPERVDAAWMKNGIFNIKVPGWPQGPINAPKESKGSPAYFLSAGFVDDFGVHQQDGAYIKIYKKGETVPDPDKTLGSGPTPI